MTAHIVPDATRTASALACSLLTWPAILALDEATLNTAIDRVIYGYTWHPSHRGDSEPGDWWLCTDVPGTLGTFSSVPYHHHTASWEHTMALCLRYDVTAQPIHEYVNYVEGNRPTQPRAWFAHTGEQHYQEISALSPDDPHALRVALCRLALWAAVQQEAREMAQPEEN